MWWVLILLNKWYAYRIFKIQTFIGTYGGQDGVNYIYQEQPQLRKSCYPQGPKQFAKLEWMKVEIEIEPVEFVKIGKVKISQMKYFGYNAYEKRNGKNTNDDGIQEETDLEIQGPFAILVHEAMILFIRGPKY